MKKLLLALIILSVALTGAFAQNDGFIKVTTAIGFGSSNIEQETSTTYLGLPRFTEIDGDGFTVLTGIDFVHPLGITLGLKYTFLSGHNYEIRTKIPAGVPLQESDNQSQSMFSFGLGYTYDGGEWCAGAKLMFLYNDFSYINIPSGISTAQGNTPHFDLGIALDGTYWIMDRLGITALFDIYFLRQNIDYTWTVIGDQTYKFDQSIKGTLFVAGLGVSLKF